MTFSLNTWAMDAYFCNVPHCVALWLNYPSHILGKSKMTIEYMGDLKNLAQCGALAE